MCVCVKVVEKVSHYREMQLFALHTAADIKERTLACVSSAHRSSLSVNWFKFDSTQAADRLAAGETISRGVCGGVCDEESNREQEHMFYYVPTIATCQSTRLCDM